MNTVELIAIVGGLLALVVVVGTLKYPVYALRKRFKKFNISISEEEAKKLSNFYAFEDDFLNEAKEIMDLDEQVSFIALADYHRMAGNFEALKEAISIVSKSDKQIPINSIITLLMTNKDVKKALDLVDRSYQVEVKGLKEEGFKVDYKAEFKIEFEQSLWLENNLELITNTVKSAISLCIVSSENKEKKKLEKELLNNYLNKDFWMTNASGIILKEELKIT